MKKSLSESAEYYRIFFGRRRVRVAVIFVLVSIILILAAFRFMNGVTQYYLVHCRIQVVEQRVEEGTWTANGFVHWTEGLTQDGIDARTAKEELVASDDVAAWCYTSGFTKTGRIVRAFTIACAIVYIPWAIFVDLIAVRTTVRKALKKRQRRRRRKSGM